MTAQSDALGGSSCRCSQARLPKFPARRPPARAAFERAIRPLALTRKNALFAGSDGGGQHWAVIASLVETCKLNGVEPHAYLSDVLTRSAEGHPNRRLDELLPWAYANVQDLKAVA